MAGKSESATCSLLGCIERRRAEDPTRGEGEGGKMVKILLPMKESVSQVESVQVKPFMAHRYFGFRIN